jgi:hypothetical protein
MKAAFNLANKGCLRSLSTSSAGFAGKALANKENKAPPHLPHKPKAGSLTVPVDPAAIPWVSTTAGPTDSYFPVRTTALNMMGGNNTIRRRQNQPAVYCAPVSD